MERTSGVVVEEEGVLDRCDRNNSIADSCISMIDTFCSLIHGEHVFP